MRTEIDSSESVFVISSMVVRPCPPIRSIETGNEQISPAANCVGSSTGSFLPRISLHTGEISPVHRSVKGQDGIGKGPLHPSHANPAGVLLWFPTSAGPCCALGVSTRTGTESCGVAEKLERTTPRARLRGGPAPSSSERSPAATHWRAWRSIRAITRSDEVAIPLRRPAGDPPGPVEFDGLDGIRFDDGSRLDFAGECERHMQENRLLVSYSYRQPLGAFSGTLPGGIVLARGLGVMEYHDAHW